MYPNLSAEMSRLGIEQKGLAKYIEKGKDAVSLKMNGKRIWLLEEAKKIKKTFFADLTIEYLFATKDEVSKNQT